MSHGDTLTAAADACRAARPPQPRRIARRLGFIGRVEYRHVYSQSGGAQYRQAATEADDLLTAYAEAFERDANAEDFSLEAIVAHERGHQLLARHPRLAKLARGRISGASEEILASLLGAMICKAEVDRENLYSKPTGELLVHGVPREVVARQINVLWELLEALL